MKTKNKWMVFAALIFFASLAEAHGVTPVKAAELSLHRLERLVELKKIEPSFRKKILTVLVEVLPHENEEDPTFKSTLFQVQAEDGSQKKLEIVLDEEGRPVSYKAYPGQEAANAPAWGDRDATTLLENGLHWVLESADAKVVPFKTAFFRATLAPATSETGTPMASVTFEGKEMLQLLVVRLNLDGTFHSFAIFEKQ